MKRFSYHEPDEYGNDVCVTVTDYWILKDFYQYWCNKMKGRLTEEGYEKLSEDDKKEMCIEDFKSLHWTKEI